MLNTDFFDDVDTQEKAYWLGFLHADGSLSANGKQIVVFLAARDRIHLERFASIFPVPVRPGQHCDKRTGKTYYRVRSILNSVHMWKRLSEMAIKSEGGGVYDHIPSDLTRHFVRGYFDGDGSIGCYGRGNRASHRFTLVGDFGFLETTRSIMCGKLGLKFNNIAPNGSIWNLAWGGMWTLTRIRGWLYADCTVCLGRKWRRFQRVGKGGSPSSRYQGVHWSNSRKKWVAKVYRDGKTCHLGTFSQEDEAARAYDRAVSARNTMPGSGQGLTGGSARNTIA